MIRAARSYAGASGPVRTFIDAAIDPYVNAIACAIANDRRRLPETIRRERDALARAALEGGIEDLSAEQKTRLLGDPLTLSRVHSQLWIAGGTASTVPRTDETGRDGDGSTLPGGVGFPRAAPLALE